MIMNIDEAAQYLGYRNAEHLEMNDISDCSKWWELIKKLVDTDKTELNLHSVSSSFKCCKEENKCNKQCNDCKMVYNCF